MNEEPVDVHRYTRALRHALPHTLGVAVAAAVVTFGISSILPKSYTASATILARNTLGSGPLDVNAASRTLATGSRLTRTTEVLTSAARSVPQTTVGELRSSVHSTADPDGGTVSITAVTGEPDQAAAMANAVAAAVIATDRRIQLQNVTDSRREALEQIAQLRGAGSTKAEIDAARNQLAELTADAAWSRSGFRMLQRAEPPVAPTSPHPVRNGVIAFFATAIVMLLIVLAREQVSPRVSTRDIDRLLSMPIVASVPLNKGLRPLDLLFLPPDVRDAFHGLASVVRNEAKTKGTRVVLVTSALPRDGRTTVAASLARALAASGADVLAVSSDMRSPLLDVWLGSLRAPGLTDTLLAVRDNENVLEVAGSARPKASSSALVAEPLKRAIHPAQASKEGKLSVLPSGSAVSDHTGLLFTDAAAKTFEGIRELPYDFVVMDGPAALVAPELQALAEHADAILVVVRDDLLDAGQVAELRDRLDALPAEKLGIAVIAREPHLTTYYHHGERAAARSDDRTGARDVVELG